MYSVGRMTNGFVVWFSGIDSYQIDKGAGGFNEQVVFHLNEFNI